MDDYEDFASREKIYQKKARRYCRKEDYVHEKNFFQEPSLKEIEKKNLKEGRVTAIRGQGIIVDCDGESYTCVLRGSIKNNKKAFKNLIVVGDRVFFSLVTDGEGAISFITPRKSVLSRADNLSRNKQHFIASNVDQVLITVSIITPLLKPSLIDRYLIAASKGNLNAVVVINKADLIEDGIAEGSVEADQLELCSKVQRLYEELGIPCIFTSITTKKNMEKLVECMQNKTSVFSGQSGVGKSSLINTVTGTSIETRCTVEKTRKGSHTTTAATLVPLIFGGWCVDTPGIKSFGIWELTPEDLINHFTEIREFGRGCRFQPCSHIHEPECCVQEALENNEIAPFRFQSYTTLLNEINAEHKKR
jgi:ribosome biogenesis GTPase / thiamine phosphate phosphatase